MRYRWEVIFAVSPVGRQRRWLGGSSAGAPGRDHPEPRRLLHEDRDQDVQGPGAQNHHVLDDQRCQKFHKQRTVG